MSQHPVSHSMIAYLLPKNKGDVSPSVYYSYNSVEYVRWYCTMLPQHKMKTNKLLLTPHGYGPDSISGMLIAQNDRCFFSFLLPPFKNNILLMQPVNGCTHSSRVDWVLKRLSEFNKCEFIRIQTLLKNNEVVLTVFVFKLLSSFTAGMLIKLPCKVALCRDTNWMDQFTLLPNSYIQSLWVSMSVGLCWCDVSFLAFGLIHACPCNFLLLFSTISIVLPFIFSYPLQMSWSVQGNFFTRTLSVKFIGEKSHEYLGGFINFIFFSIVL